MIPSVERRESRLSLRLWPTSLLDVSGRRALVAIAILWIGTTILVFQATNPRHGITLLYVLPVALTAVRFGQRAGLASAALSWVLFVVWVGTNDIYIAPAGYAVRLATFVLLAVLLGEYAERVRTLTEAQASLIESAPDAIVRADESGRIVLANAKAERLFGYAPGELIGKPVDVLVPDRFLEQHRTRRAAYAGHPRARSFGVDEELYALHRDGSEIPVEINLAPTRIEGEVMVTAIIRDVARRKLVEEELKRTSRYFRVARDLVCMLGFDGRPRELNDMWEETLGWSKAELSARPIVELVHPDDRERTAEEGVRIRAGGAVSELVNRVRTKDGDWRWLEWSALGDEEEQTIYASARDVTDRKVAEAELAVLGTVTETMAEGVVLVRAEDRTILYANPTLERMLGYPDGSLEGRPDHVLKAPGERTPRETLDMIVEGVERHGYWSGEVENLKADGSALWCRLNFSGFVHPDHGLVWVGVHTDISHEKRIDEQRRRALEEARRSNRELEQFAYAASHDLSEPLRVVGGFARLLERRFGDRFDDDAWRFTKMIVSGTDRMQSMIDGLLEYGRIGQAEIREVPVECERVVEQVVDSLGPLIEEMHGEVVVRALPTVRGEETLISHLFQNLIANGLKHAGEGQAPRVEVSGERKNGASELSVRDNGVGVSPDQRDRIFEIFQRGEGDGGAGAGIGLAVCKQVVEKHGGRIWVEAAPGGGSVFRFTLPAAA